MISFEELVEKAKEDLDINQDNLIEVSAKTGIDMVFYAEARKSWVQLRDREDAALKRISRYLWLYYNGKATAQQLQVINKKQPFKLQLNNKQDIETFIESDTEYLEQKKSVDDAEATIKFLDEVIGAIKFRAQVVRNIIQEKSTLGVN
jgi:hypothetical protein